MQYQLSDFFGALQDPRRSQGQRHKLWDILAIIIMAILSGHQGLRGFSRFAKSNAAELTEHLQLKHGVPGFNTIRDIITNLEEQLLAQKFAAWVQSYHGQSNEEHVGFDGKSVRNTTQGGNTSLQNFVAVVSAFGHQSGLVYGMQSYENGKSSEVEALCQLIAQLGLTDKVFTMDALHAKKNV